MNPTKLMSAALFVAACVTTTAIAQDDFGIESASPVVISDLVDPQPGMVFNAYNQEKWLKWNELPGSISKLLSQAAARTMVDKSEHFSLEPVGKLKCGVGRWEGYIKCKYATTYTFTLTKDGGGNYGDAFVFAVNGVVLIDKGVRQASCDANLKVGWNKIELVSQFYRSNPLFISFKPKGYLGDPRQIGPKDLFHDQQPTIIF